MYDGEIRRQHKNGAIYRIVHMVDGEISNNIVTTYRDDGTILYHKYYEKGNQVRHDQYLINGELDFSSCSDVTGNEIPCK